MVIKNLGIKGFVVIYKITGSKIKAVVEAPESGNSRRVNFVEKEIRY